ncbi:uncharacterized protein [Phaenicophaeus curvirostris]|uniref:uncharacterized protein n=1 Tax=Phaenicophaeus curvirostris TaxID=33595 RepID=UPI0037F09610
MDPIPTVPPDLWAQHRHESPRVSCPCGAQAQHPLSASGQLPAGEDTAGAKVMILCYVLLAAAGGLRLCCGLMMLKGLKGQSLAFPSLCPMSADIARVTWRSQGTHIAEAKPREMKFTVNYLPSFHNRLFIHLTNLTLEIRPLRLEDRGRYEVVVDTLSDPTRPKTFSYILEVYGDPPDDDDAEGPSGGTMGPWRVTEPQGGDTTTRSMDGGGSGGPAGCGVQDNYCVVKGYLVAAVVGSLLVLVASIHIVTRDKATETGNEVSPGPGWGSEPFGISVPQGASLWQR